MAIIIVAIIAAVIMAVTIIAVAGGIMGIATAVGDTKTSEIDPNSEVPGASPGAFFQFGPTFCLSDLVIELVVNRAEWRLRTALSCDAASETSQT